MGDDHLNVHRNCNIGSFPLMRHELNEALSRDPSLPTKSMEIQLRTLIIEPLIRCQTRPIERLVLIIDGLDECADETGTTQSDIITLLAKSIPDHNLPLQVIIASRPEYWIRAAFDTPPVPSVSFRLSLQDDDDADKDIKKFLVDGFEQIRVENSRVMESVVLPWPAENIIDHFVYQASGQYIYASTVLKFVGRSAGRFNDPQHQLRIITSPGPLQASAFSELDRLYTRILSIYPRWETMKRVIAGLLVEANTTIIHLVLGINPNELRQVLDALSSLIDIVKAGPLEGSELILESIFGCLQDGRDAIRFCHRSFKEFLEDRTRSGAFHIDLKSDPVPQEIVNRFFKNIHRNLDQNYKVQPFRFLNLDFITYHAILEHAVEKSIHYCSVGMMLPLLDSMTTRLNLFHPMGLRHMSSIFYFLDDTTQVGWLLMYFEGMEYGPLPDPGNEGPRPLHKFEYACEDLDEALHLAHQRALRRLSSCTDFNVTPALVYFTEYLDELHIDGIFEKLSPATCASDALSTLKQHSYIVPVYYSTEEQHWFCYVGSLYGRLEAIFDGGEDPVWRNRGSWKDLRILFAHHLLKSTLTSLTMGTSARYKVTYDKLGRFFDASISEISAMEYFQNSQNLAIITIITDLSLWTRVLCNKNNNTQLSTSMRFTVSILCWFNRQLTNPETAMLLHEHDPSLYHAMALAMKFIFEHEVLHTFKFPKKRYDSGFFCGTAENVARSIAMEVPPDHWCGPWNDSPLRRFHDKVFGTTPIGIGDCSTTIYVIDPLQWYPHLVSILLKLLVKCFFYRVHPLEFKTRRELNSEDDLIPYITQCLPYALPTIENLAAIQSIVYLFPQLEHSWNPPDGFWDLVVDFLWRYERSVFSSEDQALFMYCLNNPVA